MTDTPRHRAWILIGLAIVLVVMLISLGLRTGLVVASLIPMSIVFAFMIMGFAGIGLDIISFPQGASPETVPESAVLSLAIMSGPVMFILFAATVVVSSRYPLTAKRHREIIAGISERGEAPASG